jgi:hypothetical protein
MLALLWCTKSQAKRSTVVQQLKLAKAKQNAKAQKTKKNRIVN